MTADDPAVPRPAPRDDARPEPTPAPRPDPRLDARLDEILREHAAGRLGDPTGEEELDALRLAIVVEEELGVTLTDADLDLAVLTDPAALRALATRRPTPPASAVPTGPTEPTGPTGAAAPGGPEHPAERS